jgi:subtilisin family serine protease
MQKFYYANGEKILLEPSSRFAAVRAKDVSGAEGASQVASALSKLMPNSSTTVMSIPEYGFAIVPLGDNGATNIVPGGMRASALGAALDSPESELTRGPQVYELPGVVDDILVVAVGEVIVQIKPGTSADERDQILKKLRPAEVKKDELVEDRYFVRLKADEDAIEAANMLHDNAHISYAEPNLVTIGKPVARTAENSAAVEEDLRQENPSGVRVIPRESIPNALNADAMEFVAETAASGQLSDPGLSSQWGLAKIRASQAWEINPGNPGIIVAVLDEGCDVAHEDLNLALPGYDAFSNDNDPTPSGNDAHGTSCAGIVSMRKDNSRGGVGVAPGCRVLPVRIARGIGGGRWDTNSIIVDRAIRTAVARGASVLSNSYSVAPSSAVTSAFQFAATSGRGGLGCVSAAASGNDDVRGLIYPANQSASIRGMLAVGASNQWDQRKSKTSLDSETWWGSNWGPELDVVAPGVGIYTTDISGSSGYTSGNYIPNFNGTSSATPHVAGLAGLILSVDPGLRGWEVEEIIKATALDLGAGGRDEQFGFGRIDARAALEAASRVWSQISVSPVFIGAGRECFINLNVRIYNSGINSVRIDNTLIRSLTPDGSSEVDRFEYRPNPGGTMLSRSGHDIRFPKITLRANGNQASWSYRWTINWSYTFWRPSAPGLPLGAAPRETGTEQQFHGEASGNSSGGNATNASELSEDQNSLADGRNGDRVTIDRQNRTITVVIR